MWGMSFLHHMGITVGNTQAAVEFYAAVTSGAIDGPYVKSGPGVEAVTGHPGAQVVQTFITPPHAGAVIELLEYRGVPAQWIDPNNGHIGAAHPAIVVADIAAAIEACAQLGYQATADPQVATAGPIEGYLYAYVIGPDEVRVELLQAP